MEAAKRILEQQNQNALSELFKKDLKISRLEKKLERKGETNKILDQPEIIDEEVALDVQSLTGAVVQCSSLYKEFESMFQSADLKNLRSVPLSKNDNCVFVRVLCKILYKHTPRELSKRCFKHFNRKLSVNPKNIRPYAAKKEIRLTPYTIGMFRGVSYFVISYPKM